MRRTILVLLLTLGFAVPAVAAGGGGSAGGSGAQNAPANGLPPGEPGPLGAPNNPRPRPAATVPSSTPITPGPAPIKGSPRPQAAPPG